LAASYHEWKMMGHKESTILYIGMPKTTCQADVTPSSAACSLSGCQVMHVLITQSLSRSILKFCSAL